MSRLGIPANQNVKAKVEFANESQYQMIAFHKKGNKKFVIIGPGGSVKQLENKQKITTKKRKRPRTTDILFSAYNANGYPLFL